MGKSSAVGRPTRPTQPFILTGSIKLHQLVLYKLFIQSWRPLANYEVKAGVVCLQAKLCDPHLSALEVRFSRRGTIQTYLYLYLYIKFLNPSFGLRTAWTIHFFRSSLFMPRCRKESGSEPLRTACFETLERWCWLESNWHHGQLCKLVSISKCTFCIARICKTSLMHSRRNANNRQTDGFQIPSKLVWPNSWIAKIVRQWIPDCRTSRSEGTNRRCCSGPAYTWNSQLIAAGGSQVPATGNVGPCSASVCFKLMNWIYTVRCECDAGVYIHRGACTPARGTIRVLSWPVHRHNVRHTHSSSESLLQLQPHHPVRSHLSTCSSHLHSPARRGRKDRTRFVSRWLFPYLYFNSDFLTTSVSNKLDPIVIAVMGKS